MKKTGGSTSVEKITSLHLFPIGFIERSKDAAWLRIDPEFRDGILGAETFSHIWVLYWFHENDKPESRSILQVHPTQ